MLYIEQSLSIKRESLEFKDNNDAFEKFKKDFKKDTICTKVEATFYPKKYIYHILLKNKSVVFARILAESKEEIEEFIDFIVKKKENFYQKK